MTMMAFGLAKGYAVLWLVTTVTAALGYRVQRLFRVNLYDHPDAFSDSVECRALAAGSDSGVMWLPQSLELCEATGVWPLSSCITRSQSNPHAKALRLS